LKHFWWRDCGGCSYFSVAALEPAQEELHRQRHTAREQAARLADARQALSTNSVALQTERGRNTALLSEIEVVRAAQVDILDRIYTTDLRRRGSLF